MPCNEGGGRVDENLPFLNVGRIRKLSCLLGRVAMGRRHVNEYNVGGKIYIIVLNRLAVINMKRYNDGGFGVNSNRFSIYTSITKISKLTTIHQWHVIDVCFYLLIDSCYQI
jgi:hypothetical protein